MGVKFLDETTAPAPRLRFLDEEPAAPAQSPGSDQVTAITQQGEAQRRAALSAEQRRAEDEARAKAPRAEPYSPLQAGLTAAAAVPVLGAGARLAQLGLRTYPRVAPYAGRLSEMLLPRTGRELVGRGALAAGGGAAAQAVSNVLPEDTSPLARQAVELGTGMAVEGAAGAGRSALSALRPILPRGAERAGERVVRQLQPEVIESIPASQESKRQILRSMQERLRGKPIGEEIDVGEVARLLGTDAAATRRRGEALAGQLAAGTERRLAAISRPRTATEVGEEARTLATTRLEALKKTRQNTIDVNKAEAFNAARNRELAGERVNNTESFKQAEAALRAMKVDPETKLRLTTGETGSQIDLVRREFTGESFNPVTGETSRSGVSFQRLEDLRRRLGDRASGLPETGFDAIGQQQAGKLKALVENVMKEFTGGKLNEKTGLYEGGSFEKYLSDYAKASEPINKFATSVGQKLTATLEQPRGVFATDPMALPRSIFSSPRNVDDFIELTGGDKAAVERLARNYVSEQLAGKTPAQINQFLNTNKGWLAKFPVLRDDFATFAKKAQQEARVQPRLAARTEARAGRFELSRDPAEQARLFRDLIVGTGKSQDIAAAGRVLGQTEQGRQAFRGAVQEVLGTTEPGSLERQFRDRIRPAMKSSGLYTDEQLKVAEDAVSDIVKVQLAVQQAMSRASQVSGAESDATRLTRLINEEVSKVKKGGVMATVVTGALLKAADALGLPTPTAGYLVGGAGVGAALFKDNYLQYNNRIREAVNNIVTDPAKLQQVLDAPPQQRDGVVSALLRQAIGTGIGVQTPEVQEDAANQGF
jgi:hypothetical protein